MKKGLKTKLEFTFEIEDEIPDLDYEIPLKDNKINKIKIVNIKKNAKRQDSSTNSRLF